MSDTQFFAMVMGIAVSMSTLIGFVIKIAMDYSRLKTKQEAMEQEIHSNRPINMTTSNQITKLTTVVEMFQHTMTNTMTEVKKDVNQLYEKVNKALQGE